MQRTFPLESIYGWRLRLSARCGAVVWLTVLLMTTGAIAQTATTDPSTYGRLGNAGVASSLALSEQQKGQIAEILTQRDARLAEANEEQRVSVLEETDAQLAEVLSDEQRQMFADLYLKRLQFNFQYQKWADVLQWIADEGGLSLVMDAPPAGTFNYSDSKEYSPTEAIDLLNGWLQTKNYALVRRERLLMLLDLTDGVPVEAIPRITVEELQTRGRFELVSVLVPLGARPAEGAVAEITPLLGQHGEAKPLPQTKQLLVTDTAGNLRAIRATIEALPVPSSPPKPPKPPDPVLAVYPVQHANPGKVGEVLEQMISGKVVVDDAASQLTINAVPAEQERAKSIIAQLEENQGPDKQPRLETYPAPQTNVGEVIATLQLVAPSAQIRSNGVTRQLQVWATPQDQQKVRDALSELGSDAADGGQSQLTVYPVSGVTPQAAMTALTTVMPGIRVTVDTTGNKLIVVGSLAEHQAVARLIEQLAAPGDLRLETTVRTYPLTRVDGNVSSLLTTLVPSAQVSVDSRGTQLVVIAAGPDHERIASILEQLGTEDASLKRSMVSYPLDRRLDLATVTSLLSNVAARAQVTADATNHRLLVIATAADHESVAATIEQAAKDAGVELPELEFYTVEKVDPSRAQQILQSLTPAAQITVDAGLKRLSVVARPEDHETIKETLAKLEEVSGDREQRALKVYGVTPSQKSRFSSLAANLASELTQMQVLSDAEPGELAVWATPSEHSVVESILEQLERALPDELTPKLVSYPLLKTDAQSLSAVLTPLFPDVRINVDAKANRLLVWARPAQHDTFREALKELDTDAPVEVEFRLMVYPVDGVTPEVAAQLVQSELPGVTVITDSAAKALIIRARNREHERIAKMLDAVQGTRLGTRERSVVVYPSIPGDPNEIYNFFARSIPSASVLVDRATGRMSVWATEAEHAQIRRAVADMVEVGAGGLKSVLKTYTVRNAPPGAVAQLAIQVAPTAKLAISADGRNLSVWAREADHVLIQGVVDGLASGPAEFEDRSVAVFDVTQIGTGAARTLLAPIVPQVTFADAPGGGALLAWVNEQDRQRIEAALGHVLSDEKLSGERELKIYDLTDVGGSQAQQVLSSTMPTVGFTSTDGGKTVVVWARRIEHEQIAATIAELEQSQPFEDDRTMQVYSIRDLGPNVNAMIGALVPGAQINPGPQSDKIAVVGRPEDQKKVSDLISRLKAGSRPRYRTVAVYDIGRADPQAVQQIMQPLMGPDVQITVDAKTRRLFVRTYTDLLEDIEAIVKRVTVEEGDDGSLVTRTYEFERGEAEKTRQVLAALMPDATLVTDNNWRVLAATATAEQHEMIASLVEEMSGEVRELQPVTYPLKNADPDSTLQTLQQLFRRAWDVSLSVDRTTRTLVAIARPEVQEKIRELVEQLDRPTDDGNLRTVRVYPMRGTNPGSAIEIVRSLLEGIDPDASVAYDGRTERVVVTTLAEGHVRVREMTDSFDSTDDSDVEVFQLERMDPDTARDAIEGLFRDRRTSREDRPAIEANLETQQLVVRGSPEQIEQIRELLIKMGEIALADSSGASRKVRIIPVDGDIEQALPRIKQLWPRFRKNPLRILRPGADGEEVLPLEETPADQKDEATSAIDDLRMRRFVQTQTVSLTSDDEGAETSPATGDSSAAPEAESLPADEDAAPPPIVIIPGEDRITIASEDTDALNQLELLLRNLVGPRDSIRGRDFTVYALQNASAVTVADTINEFFRRNSPVSSGNVLVVPDSRLNALVVYAGRSDRQKVENLIETLDSENIPDSLATYQTRIVPVKHADAAKMSRTLEGIYKAQMSAGGARRNVSIPDDVPSSIASMLRQINAAASSPLLTVEVDYATNSLVLMAPSNLLKEVEELIIQLDEAAAVSDARELRIIPLKKVRSTRVMELLQRITD